MDKLTERRTRIRSLHHRDQRHVLADVVQNFGLSRRDRMQVQTRAVDLIADVHAQNRPKLMDRFLADYGLDTDEGLSLMCLAEAFLRTPDAPTLDALIADKVAPFADSTKESGAPLIQAATRTLRMTAQMLKAPQQQTVTDRIHGVIRRLGEPLVRAALRRAMTDIGRQFVRGQTIAEATAQAQEGQTYSYDMLGEAARTAAEVADFYAAYDQAITHLSGQCRGDSPRQNPGISVKLSALHPRYETRQKDRVMTELVPRVRALACRARQAGLGFTIDAEESERLDLSLDVIAAVLQTPDLSAWTGFGVVVQAYDRRASAVIEWLDELARSLDRQIMVRLVKGAYWDREIKRAQVEGVADFPVFTHKSMTDVSYLCCARQLLAKSAHLFPQFATHNAHSLCAILQMAQPNQSYEFQRLHGMGEALHDLVRARTGTPCRVYAPVGAHRNLLAYLVRRLLENGANSSFVNQIADDGTDPALIAADPFAQMEKTQDPQNAPADLTAPGDLYQPDRANSRGWDLQAVTDLTHVHQARTPFKSHQWHAQPLVAGLECGRVGPGRPVYSPNDCGDCLGTVAEATETTAAHALSQARVWSDTTVEDRKQVLDRVAALYEDNHGELCAVLCREAGKTASDAIAELREAVDFLRFYGAEALRLKSTPRGVITCLSPWNFPLAIFTGQIAAALAVGNGVVAKPAQPTAITAWIAVRLMQVAGIPKDVLQLVPGDGPVIGKKLTTDPRVAGLCFTGSTAVAQTLYRNTADSLEPESLFIAETGGVNAMIVDSTALPEQAVQDIVESAFRSCGQRCSALRVLYLQRDIADDFLRVLFGAMDELTIGHPWDLATDIGPLITAAARADTLDYIVAARREGRLLKQLDVPHDLCAGGFFIGPAVITGTGIPTREVFGPVLHVCTFAADEIDAVVDAINDAGFGLTFGLHSRIDTRVRQITRRLTVGNLYVNRNQIGAVVGTQPFGGEGLSGTGPKAGGPHYLPCFQQRDMPVHPVVPGACVDPVQIQKLLDAMHPDLLTPQSTENRPGPTGESNRLSLFARGTILCLGPTAADARKQMEIARQHGCTVLGIAPGLSGPATCDGFLDRASLRDLNGFDAVALWSERNDLIRARQCLAGRAGPLIPLIPFAQMAQDCLRERHLCTDTTAAGGNATLLQSVSADLS